MPEVRRSRGCRRLDPRVGGHEGRGARGDASSPLLGVGRASRSAVADRVPRSAERGGRYGRAPGGTARHRPGDAVTGARRHARPPAARPRRRRARPRGGRARRRGDRAIRAAHGDDSPRPRPWSRSSPRCTRAGRTRVACASVGTMPSAGQALTVSGLGAFTLLRPRPACTCSRCRRASVRPSTESRCCVTRRTARSRGPTGPNADVPPASEPTSSGATGSSPSPLVRDASGARTGRIDRVLGGDFDLVARDGRALVRRASRGRAG